MRGLLELVVLVLLLLVRQLRPEALEAGLVDFSSFKSFKPKLDIKNFLPKIPKHIELFIAAAFPAKEFKLYSKVFSQSLNDITNSFLVPDTQQRNYNVTVRPLFFVIPESGRFSSSIYEVMCMSFDSKRVAAILVVGESPAAFTVAMAAITSNIPVLWARGEAPSPPGSLPQTDSLEIRLEPEESQLLEAVRGVLMATHWHTFTVMAAPSLASRSAAILDQDPLNPKVVPISRSPHAIFRKLADVSRATRGVVLLLCDVTDAMRVMDVAKRLNMVDGHFVWLWIDTTTKPASFLSTPPSNITHILDIKSRRRENGFTRSRRNASAVMEHRSNGIKLNESAGFRQKVGNLLGKRNRNGDLRDYVSDFAVGEETGEGEEEGEDDEEPPTMSKAWGKITELFPVRNENKEDRDAQPKDTSLPLGMLAVKPEPVRLDKHLVRGTVRLLISSLHTVLRRNADLLSALDSDTSCWQRPTPNNKNFSIQYAREIRRAVKETLSGDVTFQDGDRADRSLLANFQILNLVPEKFSVNFINDAGVIEDAILSWRSVGRVIGRTAHLDTIVWPGGDLVASALSARTRSVFRIVTALAPPFVMEGAMDEDGQCLRGVICHRVLNSDKDNLTLVFNEMDTQERQEEEEEELGGDDKTERPMPDSPYLEYNKYKYKSSCCYGLAMDLLENMAQELQFEFHLYITPDGLYGATTHVWEPTGSRPKWNGIVGDLVSGAAHMSFAALSVSKHRSQVIDFSTPYFFGGVSFLAAPSQRSEVPLLAFLLPFSPELWIAIFTSLNITAMAVACYEWLSPFGLNPWGRQRSRNFSIASALWVCWGLLCGHLVAFKAPKSWPNKFLINVWGGFSVIFVASYTANIAALIAGLFFHNSVSDYYDGSLLIKKVGAPRASAAEYYINRANPHLFEHMRKYTFKDLESGIALLKNGSLDMIVADTPILDYYRMTDHGCKLQKIVEAINEDTYAIGMNKGFPLKESISAVISKYNNNGYIDILKEKWYGGLPCYKTVAPMDIDMAQPRPLGVAAVAGVFLLLLLGVVVGVLILIMEHLFYRYTLPILRHQPKGTIWRSRNIMFFSQKLYRFINCVELVSPHHAARELVHTLRQGQITSLFQKSVRRKEHEQRRRRKSKAQFFEMIQEIRRVQQEERDDNKLAAQQPDLGGSPRSPLRTFLTSPRSLKQAFTGGKEDDLHQRRTARSASRLDIRRFSKELFSLPRSPRSPKDKSLTSLDSVGRLSARGSSAAIGRRLSKDATNWLSASPPDINTRRRSHLDIAHTKSLNTEENTSPSSGKYLTLSSVNLRAPDQPQSPAISNAATLRLAGNGVKVRPRLPSPPLSPVVPLRNLSTPKIDISDTSLYDTIQPEKPKSTHSRSKSLDNKPLNLTLVEIPATPLTKAIAPATTSASNASVTTKTPAATVTITSEKNNEKQTVNYATIDKTTLKTIKNNTKPIDNNSDKCSYAEMSQSQKQTILKQNRNDDKPKVPPKNNALKQMQARAYSAPESFRPQATTVIFIPEEKFKNHNYKKCFETFPKETRSGEGHRSRYDAARCGSVGRSSSVPEQQRYVVTARSDAPEQPKHKKETVTVTVKNTAEPSPAKSSVTRTQSTPVRTVTVQATPTRASHHHETPSRTSATHHQETPARSSASHHHHASTADASHRASNSHLQDPSRHLSNHPHVHSFDGSFRNKDVLPRSVSHHHSASFDGSSRASSHHHETPPRSSNYHQSSFDAPPRSSSTHHQEGRSSVHPHGFFVDQSVRSGSSAHHHEPSSRSSSFPLHSILTDSSSRSYHLDAPSKPSRHHHAASLDAPPRRSGDHRNDTSTRSASGHHSFDELLQSRQHGADNSSSMSAMNILATPKRTTSLATPSRSGSNQQTSQLTKGSPKRSTGGLQFAPVPLDVPPRSSSLYQQAHATPSNQKHVQPTRTPSQQSAVSSQGTPTKTAGILKTRRRSRSRDLDEDIPPAPPSPDQRDRIDSCDREILLTIKKQTQGYMKPP